MRHAKNKYRSIFYIAGIFVFLLVVQVAMFSNFFTELKQDTQIINDFSRIRGSLQRYVKLELSGVKVEGLDLETYISNFLSNYAANPAAFELDNISKYYDLKTLQTKWNELTVLIDGYHENPTQEKKLSVIEKSEECWQLSDAYVLRNQHLLSKTTAYYKYFTIAFALNIFILIVALFVYKRFIHNTLTESAIHDSLTGIFNKGYFDEYLKYEIARAARKRSSFSLIMLDIDHFKMVNDTYGHLRGDYALKTLTEVVGKCKRKVDVLARIGGEEFIILLPDTKLSEAALLAERIRKGVEDFAFEEIGTMLISLGVTELNNDDDNESILNRVDSALYKAKENGRNRYEVIDS